MLLQNLVKTSSTYYHTIIYSYYKFGSVLCRVKTKKKKLVANDYVNKGGFHLLLYVSAFAAQYHLK